MVSQVGLKKHMSLIDLMNILFKLHIAKYVDNPKVIDMVGYMRRLDKNYVGKYSV